ncbi:MAG: sigma 54-interacting transcriptional regulator [Vicinamibacterales bacterium]
MLLIDRFLQAGGTALDLATGQTVRIRVVPAPSTTALFSRRGSSCLIDAAPRSSRTFVEAWERWGDGPVADPLPIDGVLAAMADARDGHPRAVDVTAADGDQWRRAAHDIARAAREAGFVPIGADVLGELLRAARWQWPRWLADRALVVLTCDGCLSAPATLALLRLASRDARPHLVIRGATSVLHRPTRLVRLSSVVHEGPGEGPEEPARPEALAERAWQAAEAGENGLAIRAAARWAVMLAPTADTEARARAALAHTLICEGRTLEARAALAPGVLSLPHLSPEASASVRTMQDRLRVAEEPRHGDRGLTDDFLRVLEVCQAVEDEAMALGRLLVLLRDRLGASGLAFVVEESGRRHVLCHLGASDGDMRAAGRTLASGHATLPEASAPDGDGAWPVRYGGLVIGALWCRWSTGLPVLATDAHALMKVAALASAPMVHAVHERGQAAAASPDIPGLVGESDLMRDIRAALLRAARSPFPVLIEGESGSGKELVARAIHRASPRRDRRFSALNCAALSEELAEAELFGHARGAFTGAVVERAGLFEEANGGTLFLDEVSELSARIQAKLLRVLQEHEVRRVGEAHVRRIDVRIVAATNKPLAAEVEAGRFRRDLRYRLDVVRLTIPPLRERLEDIPALVRHVWASLCEKTGSRAVLSAAAMAALGRYDWPGNVRELQNVLASVIVTSPPRGLLPMSQLPAHVARTAALADGRTLADARRDFESRYVRAALARAGGRHGAAARELGVSRQGLAKLLARLGLSCEARGHEARAQALRGA